MHGRAAERLMPATAVRWLGGASLVTVAVGLVAAAASTPATAGPWRALFDVLTWPVDGEPSRFSREAAAVNAVVGGVMVGWGSLMYFVTAGPFRRGDTTLATPMLIAVRGWFVVDSTGSLLADIPGNVILNVGFLCLFVPPLLTLRHHDAT